MSSGLRIMAVSVCCVLVVAGCARIPPGIDPGPALPASAAPAPAASAVPSVPVPVPVPSAQGPAAQEPAPTASETPAGQPDHPGWVTRGHALADRRTAPGHGEPRGPNTTDRVVLTYDDCPKSKESFTETVLGAEQLGVRLVLFPLGTCVKKGTVDIAFAHQHGMFVFGHSVTHPQFTKLSDAAIRAQLRPPAVQGAWMRPPYGAADARVKAVIAAAGVHLWQWSLDTEDWLKKPADQVVEEVSTEAQPGDTVLMHLQWNGFSTEAIARMKAGLAARGVALCRNTGPVDEATPFSC